MTTVATQECLNDVMANIRKASYEEKRDLKSEEEILNSFLDSINVIKKDLTDKTDKINDISNDMEKLSWLHEVDDDILRQLNELIVLAKDTKGTLIKQYVRINNIMPPGTAKECLVNFKHSIDLFKETYTDLENAFFIFPKDNAFQEITKALSE